MQSTEPRINRRNTEANRRMLEIVSRVLTELLDRSLVCGFHGDIGLTVTIADGTIQGVRERQEASHR